MDSRVQQQMILELWASIQGLLLYKPPVGATVALMLVRSFFWRKTKQMAIDSALDSATGEERVVAWSRKRWH